MRRPPLALVAAVVVLLIPTGVIIRGDEPLLQVDDTYIQAEDAGWVIANPLVRFSIGGHGGGPAGLRGIVDATSERDWHRSGDPDSFVTVNGQRINLGASPMTYQGADVTEWWGGVKLSIRYRVPSAALQVTRSYAAYPGSSVIESWTTYFSESRSVTLSDLNNYAFDIPNGTLHWVTGLGKPADTGGAFTKNSGDLDDGQNFDLASQNRASEDNLPWFAVSADDQQFFGSILWNGAWALHTQRRGDNMRVQIGLPAFSTTLGAGATLEAPHAIFGFTNATVPEPSMALRTFIEKGVRHGRTLKSYVSYNTWYSYGTFIDEGSMFAEMELAAAVGIEQFVIDAGWWFHINPEDQGDFARNWGRYDPDPERFPNGLGVLADRAHELGMRFGVWVEPERVDMTTVGEPGLAKERFLATSGGRYDPSLPNSQAPSAQVCLVDPEARTWVVEKLTHFIEDVHPDYLKWDNNFWINCNRAGHGHGAADGNFQHHRSLQMTLDSLRGRFPELDIENCSSGGNRLSLDMLAYSDAAWMDDRTDPSVRVRHDLQGLSTLFPSPYLLSFAIAMGESVDDRVTGGLPYVLRSRMSGALGISARLTDMGEGGLSELTSEIAVYKRLRPYMQEGASFALGAQPTDYPDQRWANWDVTEHLVQKTGDAVLVAFDSYNGPDRAVVHPKGLRPDVMYEIESVDQGVIGQARGSELMERGIEMQAVDELSRGHIFILRALNGDVGGDR